MDLVQLILHNLLAFTVIISVIVFIHEFGHFFVARLCGVRVDEFAIGFGPELIGYTDKKGTRWKICPIPFGGYVKMFGDKNGASVPDSEVIAAMSKKDRKESFIGKNVWQRMAIVLAGPAANFILTIAIFTALFRISGLNVVLPVVDQVVASSAASESDLKSGDMILAINGEEIVTFDEIRAVVSRSAGEELQLKLLRENEEIFRYVTPKTRIITNFFGEEVKVGMLGISARPGFRKDLTLEESFFEATKETYVTSIAIFRAIGELITGKRSVDELSGPIKIAKYSGKTVEMGMVAVFWFAAMISLNLGVMNLLPIPVLDGGHLFYYIIEAIRRRPLSQKIQQAGFRLGLGFVLTLMLFTIFNDARQIVGGM